MHFEESTERETWTPQVEAAMLQVVLDAAPACLAALAKAEDETDAFAHLPRAACSAFHLGRFDEARVHAIRSLELAASFPDNWNYGNALHLGHTVLGLLALRDDDESTALRELDLSGRTPGSPQLASFGPTMHLAKDLLKRGHSSSVLDYLRLCRSFWVMGDVWLTLWESVIRSDRVPNFFQHSHA